MDRARVSVGDFDGRIENPLEKLATIGEFREGPSPNPVESGETMNVSHESGSALNFHALLFELDRRAQERVRAGGCERCRGPLHVAHYPRKVRGVSEEAAEAGRYGQRLSLCCGREGCRKRATPPSVRFDGRRLYAAIAVLLLSMRSRERPELEGAAALVQAEPSPSWPTRSRWRSWWRSELLQTAWFVALRGHLARPVDAERSPASLLSMFGGGAVEQCRSLLVAISPLTTRSVSLFSSQSAMAS